MNHTKILESFEEEEPFIDGNEKKIWNLFSDQRYFFSQTT
jgi:hypothetical protein